MSSIIDNAGFIIIGAVVVYLFILIVKDVFLLAYKKKNKRLYNQLLEAVSDYNKLLLDYVILKDEAAKLKQDNNKDQDLEDWILKERFVDDLQKMKDKADDFASRLEMQSTERDAEEYQSKLKIVK